MRRSSKVVKSTVHTQVHHPRVTMATLRPAPRPKVGLSAFTMPRGSSIVSVLRTGDSSVNDRTAD
eukprot:3890209-Prymnesium_polylepis.1